MTNYIGDSSRHTGDVNLAAALMALGVPLNASRPVTVVDRHPQPYGSFYYGECSEDGTEDAETLCAHWNGISLLPPKHGFPQICQFIRARPRGVQSTPDLLGFAVEYLTQQGHGLPGLRRIEDVPAFVAALPEGEPAHILAYVWNRSLCFQLFRNASRALYYEAGDASQIRRALIDTQLPRVQARELLARLQD